MFAVTGNRKTSGTRSWRALLLVGVLALLSACGASSLVVEGSYPTPAVRKIPLSLGLYLSEDLRNFLYIEYTETGAEEYRVSSGQTHVQMFSTLLPAMFEQVQVLESMDAAPGAGVDAVFAPSIEEFQLALPQKTRLDSYEVWVKYNMRLLGPDGAYIADWVLTSYGKTSMEGLLSVEGGINEATVSALRDLASNFALSFGAVPEVRDWLASRQNVVSNQ